MDDNNQNPNPQPAPQPVDPNQQPPAQPQPGDAVGPGQVAPSEFQNQPTNAQVPTPGQSVVPPSVAGNIPGNTVQPGVEGPAVVQDRPVVTAQPQFTQEQANPQTQQFINAQQVQPPGPGPQQSPQPQQPVVPVPPQQPQQPIQPAGPPAQAIGAAPVVQPKAGPSKKIIFVIIVVALVSVGLGVVFLLFSGGEELDGARLKTQLKSDANTLWSALDQNQTQSGSALILTPEAVAEFASTYLPANFADPRTDAAYILVTERPNVGEIQYLLGGRCIEGGDIEQTGNSNAYAVAILLPSADYYCIDTSGV